MKRRGIIISLAVGLATLISHSSSYGATRARFRAETILNDAAVRFSAGSGHTCQVNEDGTVRCWGKNDAGQLGNGSTSTGPTVAPAAVMNLTGAIAISVGGRHSCALLFGGSVKCWGANNVGQLGNGTTSTGPTSIPVLVSGLTNAVAISAGPGHTCAVLADGSAKCWGANGRGQVGDGTTLNSRVTPVAVVTSANNPLTNVVALAPAGNHTCALLAIGTVRCWGDNSFGQLGDNRASGVQSLTPVFVNNLSNAIAIDAGFSYTCAVLADGTARCWGIGSDTGTLGDGTTLDRPSPVAVIGLTNNIVAIATGGAHTCALLADGTGRCWGSNNRGQIGDGFMKDRLTAVPVGNNFNPLSNAVAINIGDAHSCAVLADGSVKCWGDNSFGQLGSATMPANIVPTAVFGGGGTFTARDVAAGRNHTCAVRANGTVACWGSNDSGQIGDGTVGGTRLSPVTVSGLTNVVAIAAGESHTCALLANGTGRCWGLNASGQLGNSTVVNSATPVPVSNLTNAVAIAAGGALGSSHACALIANGTVRCWGANGSGQLGNNSTLPNSTPQQVFGLLNAVSIAVGEFHSCAVVAVGAPFCWGFNGSGRLGDGSQANSSVPKLVSLDNTVAVAGGNTHTCALRADGTAWCWGANLLGQLGINSTASPQVAPRLVVNFSSVVAIAGGFGHSCEILANGSAQCWGDNSVGQLGNSTLVSSLTPTAVLVSGFSFTLASASSTQSEPIRSLFFVRPAAPTVLGNAVTITTGRRHSCALTATGGVFCWGENTVGQLGLGSTTNQVNAVSVPSFTLNINPNVTLEQNDRISTVTVLATCEAGHQLHVEVTLTQGAASGHGVGQGQCTGGLEAYPVTVPAEGNEPFAEGSAQVEAAALIRDRGLAVDTQEWVRTVTLTYLPR